MSQHDARTTYQQPSPRCSTRAKKEERQKILEKFQGKKSEEWTISGKKEKEEKKEKREEKKETEIATGLGRKKETEDNYMKWESIVFKWGIQ